LVFFTAPTRRVYALSDPEAGGGEKNFFYDDPGGIGFEFNCVIERGVFWNISHSEALLSLLP